MRIRLPPPVAGRRHSHEARIQPVLQVADQDAVLDQHRAVGRGAFVIHRQAAATIRHRAVIDHGHTGGSDPLAQQVRERRGLLAVEVAFQAVPDRLMQQNARPAGAQHYRHLTRRCGSAVQVDQGLP